MITLKGMTMFEEIKKLKSLKLKPSQVAKKLNINTRTVKKYWDMSEADFLNLLSTFSRNKSASKLDFFKSDILEYLNAFHDFTAAQIFDRLKEENSNFSLSESSVRKYVAKLKNNWVFQKKIEFASILLFLNYLWESRRKLILEKLLY